MVMRVFFTVVVNVQMVVGGGAPAQKERGRGDQAEAKRCIESHLVRSPPPRILCERAPSECCKPARSSALLPRSAPASAAAGVGAGIDQVNETCGLL